MDDRERVAQLLGRPPQGAFDVVVRDRAGDPVVVRNAPFLDDGTPMPTRYYLVGTQLVRAVSRVEAAGGVNAAEAEIDADEVAATHRRYAAERDAVIPTDHVGPRPSGGVGGTRVGVKCLHAHVAHLLAGGDDPVGRWTLERIGPDATSGIVMVPTNEPGEPTTTASARPTSTAVPGAVQVHLGDHVVGVTMTGGASFELPIGPLTLVADMLASHDPPSPVDLTNALGLVHDHLDDVLIAAPTVAAAPSITVFGEHAMMLARVEIGATTVPDGYALERSDADEVFRTLVLETRNDRHSNPGLAAEHVDSIIGTCCVILGLMRRLDLPRLPIAGSDGANGTGG